MFERFSDCARSVMFLANDFAAKCGHAEVLPEHMVIGLLRVMRGGDQPGKAAFVELTGKDGTDSIEREILDSFPESSPARVLPPSQATQNAIKIAIKETDATKEFNDGIVRIGHLLIGVLSQEGPAAIILHKHGINRDNVMAMIQKYLRIAREQCEASK